MAQIGADRLYFLCDHLYVCMNKEKTEQAAGAA